MLVSLENRDDALDVSLVELDLLQMSISFTSRNISCGMGHQVESLFCDKSRHLTTKSKCWA